jgi:hypothetical protein
MTPETHEQHVDVTVNNVRLEKILLSLQKYENLLNSRY